MEAQAIKIFLTTMNNNFRVIWISCESCLSLTAINNPSRFLRQKLARLSQVDQSESWVDCQLIYSRSLLFSALIPVFYILVTTIMPCNSSCQVYFVMQISVSSLRLPKKLMKGQLVSISLNLSTTFQRLMSTFWGEKRSLYWLQ